MSKIALLMVFACACACACLGMDAPEASLPFAAGQTITNRTASITAIMKEAAALGMPSIEGATLFQGTLTFPDSLERWSNGQDLVSQPVHARLTDGSWLIGMWKHVTEDQLDLAEIVDLQQLHEPVSRKSVKLASGSWQVSREAQVLCFARLVQMGQGGNAIDHW